MKFPIVPDEWLGLYVPEFKVYREIVGVDSKKVCLSLEHWPTPLCLLWPTIAAMLEYGDYVILNAYTHEVISAYID